MTNLNMFSTRMKNRIFGNIDSTSIVTLYVHGPLCSDRALKSMTWYNKFGIHYLFNDVPFSLLSILIPCIILYEHSCLHLLYCTWLRYIRSCTEDLSHGFLSNRRIFHNCFIGLGNPLKVVVHHLLIRRMASLSYRDELPMVSALVYMVTY